MTPMNEKETKQSEPAAEEKKPEVEKEAGQTGPAVENETKQTETAAEEEKQGKPRFLARRRRLQITLGVVAGVIVIAGCGFWVWHEQPSFCSAICHTPMDPYLPTYESPADEPGTDKWGNEVSNSNAMMASLHREQSDATCLSCHVPTLGEQVTEAANWITGNYEVLETQSGMQVLAECSLDDLVAARGVDADEFCLNESCHNMTRDDLIEATSDMYRNPHVAQHRENSCSDCHKAHRASVNTCTECHSDAELPDGWISFSENKQLLKELQDMQS